MTQKDPKPDTKQDARKPYEKPRVLYREPLEAVAVACSPPGKSGPAESCSFGSS